ncbi:GyrI-like domain-containing protein [Pseudomonas oryzihabitans]|uniref:Transcriptional regulator n=1 Tax=Pseudomonas oryzihabitans TaxID=47885 RepID=A0A0U4P6Z7_9PSED|nr:GyrI-like domain-containing protein [Pseudomonas oryzihabitans]ALZ86142.1 transcriptional regulator [Pseudomonas oryzihabitans]
MSLEIVDHPALEVTGLLFEPGQGEDIAALWRRFADRAGEITGREGEAEWYGLSWRQAGAMHYLAAVATAPGTPLPAGMVRQELPEGRYARYVHLGTAPSVAKSLGRLFAELLPARGLQPRPGACFEHYTEAFTGVDAQDSQIYIYVPVF